MQLDPHSDNSDSTVTSGDSRTAVCTNSLRRLWCILATGDVVYMDSDEKLAEYVLSQDGIIFRGTYKHPVPTPWNFGQVPTPTLTIPASSSLSAAWPHSWPAPITERNVHSSSGYVMANRPLFLNTWHWNWQINWFFFSSALKIGHSRTQAGICILYWQTVSHFKMIEMLMVMTMHIFFFFFNEAPQKVGSKVCLWQSVQTKSTLFFYIL